MILYHTTKNKFLLFNSATIGERFWLDNALDKAGYWFSPSKKMVQRNGKT